MIPTKQILTANRRLFVVLGGTVAAAIMVVAFASRVGATARWATIGLALLAGAVVYRSGTMRNRRRLKALDRGLDRSVERLLNERVDYYRRLDRAGREKFQALATIFLDETRLTGAGVEIDDEVRALVAASAVIPIMGFPDWEYESLREVVVRPGEFRTPAESQLGGNTDLLGMVSPVGGTYHGSLFLALEALRYCFAFPEYGRHVGIHEFTHLIDEADGGIDGVPAGLPEDLYSDWHSLVRDQLTAGPSNGFMLMPDSSRVDRRPPSAFEDWSDMDEYAYTNEQEFFAVSAEYFFQDPQGLAMRHPMLYDILRRTFRQDPAGLG